MKKIMFIAVMMSALLMPAQMMANNREKAKPRVERRVDNRKEHKGGARPGKPNDRNVKKKRPHDKPMAGHPKPMPKPKPTPRRRPVPPPPPRHHHHHHHCDNGAIKAAATIIGVAAIVSAIAD